MTISHARAPIVVTHQGGLKFVAQVGSHRITVDQPLRAGGGDSGPAPLELIGVSLGTCVALYVQQFCHARGLLHEGMRVLVEQFGAHDPNRIGRFVVRVLLPTELPERYVKMLDQVARSCPAHNTLVHEAEVVVEIETPIPAVV